MPLTTVARNEIINYMTGQFDAAYLIDGATPLSVGFAITTYSARIIGSFISLTWGSVTAPTPTSVQQRTTNVLNYSVPQGSTPYYIALTNDGIITGIITLSGVPSYALSGGPLYANFLEYTVNET